MAAGYNFASDNTAGASPEIIEALSRASEGAAMPYGNDEVTDRLRLKFAEIFERDVELFLVATGSGANSLALAAMAPPWGAVYCHEFSHVNTDECGAPEMFTGGCKLVPLIGEHGMISPTALERALTESGLGDVHRVQPAALSLTQLTEAGTAYSAEQIAELCGVAKRYGMRVHMDGARFANAVATLECSPAEITWRAGVDALSFGATKNGAFAAEAIVFFDPPLAESVEFRRKRAGHLVSKMRFLSAQLEAYLEDDLWLRNAAHANAMTQRLAGGLAGLPGVSLLHPVGGNEIFPQLPRAVTAGLREAGFVFYPWGPGDEDNETVRLICAFNTPQAAVDQFIEVAAEASAPVEASA